MNHSESNIRICESGNLVIELALIVSLVIVFTFATLEYSRYLRAVNIADGLVWATTTTVYRNCANVIGTATQQQTNEDLDRVASCAENVIEDEIVPLLDSIYPGFASSRGTDEFAFAAFVKAPNGSGTRRDIYVPEDSNIMSILVREMNQNQSSSYESSADDRRVLISTHAFITLPEIAGFISALLPGTNTTTNALGLPEYDLDNDSRRYVYYATAML